MKRRIWVLIAGLASVAPALAHDFTITRVLCVIRQDGSFIADLTIDVDALALGARPEESSAELAATLRALPPDELAAAIDQARRTVLRWTRLRVDGELIDATVTFPEYGGWRANPDDVSVLGTIGRLAGRMPVGASEFVFGASRAFNAVELTILEEETLGGARHTLAPGEDCPAYRLGQPGATAHDFVVTRYLALGFEHIIPKGLDHILFVLGLFLLSTELRPLVWQVTAFTVAHSITLALSLANIASLPSSVVEPLIALSIAYVAIENLFVRDLTPWRPAVVFVFGLLHGMGFAGVLRELGMPAGQFVPALIGFNVGVELGQLSVIAIAWLAVGWFRRREWYRYAIVWPVSGLIALVGLYWAFERAFAG